MENIHKLSGCRKEHADHFPVEDGSNFPVESENFPDTPMEALVTHPTNTEDARNGAGQSQMCRVLAILLWNSTEKGRLVPGTGPIFLSRGGFPFVPGTVPVCPGHRPAENVYVYWFFFLPD